ncbi:hypothetical protein LUZ60_005068 [Juncus effusus]|nr:hypothetical protein LUZ60_005068 [Juncus effusus]
MDESVMLDWDQFQPLSQINQATSCDKFFEDLSLFTNCYTTGPTTAIRNNASNNDQTGFLQQGNNYWNSHNTKPITLEFGANFQSRNICTGENLISSNGVTKEKNEAFGCNNKRNLQGGKMVNNKGIVPTNNTSQDHIIAERRRREKLKQRFVELSSIIPCLTKTDKASILIDAVRYIKELEDKVKSLEAQNPKSIDSAVLVKTSSFSSRVDHSCSSFTEPLPRIDVKLLANNMLVNIHCENIKGVLVKILSEIEELNFTVTHTNLMPFPGCTVFITLTAQIKEGINISVENVVQKLNSVLNQLRSRNSNY